MRGVAPLDWHRSLAFVADKGNRKAGVGGEWAMRANCLFGMA